MILGTGIDAVTIERCAEWHTYSDERLRRIFHPDELDYCRANAAKSAERFAVRFAAKEALLKALSAAWPDRTFALPAVCRAAQIVKGANGVPQFQIDWAQLGITTSQPPACALSITHTESLALAQVILHTPGQ